MAPLAIASSASGTCQSPGSIETTTSPGASTAPSAQEVAARLGALDVATGVRPVPGRDGEYTFAVDGALDSDLGRSVFRLARDAGWELGELRPVVRDLDTVFRELVREHAVPAEEAA